MNNKELEEHWNQKHPKQRLIYRGRSMSKVTKDGMSVTDKILIDVRNLIDADDVMLQDIIRQYKLKGTTHDDTMIRIQRFVCRYLTYVGDDDQQGVAEYWQFPFETIHTQLGDCEDGAILITSLAINAGVPSFRVRVVAGLVKPHEITAPEGGHGYTMYVRESDNQPVAIDWCFYQDPEVEIKDKPLLKDNSLYKEVWFSFNNKYAYSAHDFEVPNRVKMKK